MKYLYNTRRYPFIALASFQLFQGKKTTAMPIVLDTKLPIQTNRVHIQNEGNVENLR